MTRTVASPYDVAEHLRTPEETAACLEACMEEAGGDAAFIARAPGDIARAMGNVASRMRPGRAVPRLGPGACPPARLQILAALDRDSRIGPDLDAFGCVEC